MSWGSKASQTHRARKAEWNYSSGDEQSNRSTRIDTPKPASTAEEALWRVAKRLSSSWRWLTLDLALLADDGRFKSITDSLEATLRQLGMALLPNLGKSALPIDLTSRLEVLDLVGVLAAVGRTPSKQQTECQNQASNQNTAGVQVTRPTICAHTHIQTHGEYMIRYSPHDFVGERLPLEPDLVRRGSLLRCVSPATTDNDMSHNIRISKGDLMKVVRFDSDKDIQVILLQEVGVGSVWWPSKRYWLLQQMSAGFEILLHPEASSLPKRSTNDVGAKDT